MSRAPIPVVRHTQKGYTVYMGHLPNQDARDVIFADHYPPTPGRAGYQRPPDMKRAQSFARYLTEDPAAFMTPVLLNARRPVRFEQFPGKPEMGYLYLEKDAAVAIVDGQHRSLGVLDFLGDRSWPIPFMLFDLLPVEQEEQLFMMINREQKRVSMSHVHFLARGQDPLAEMVTRLESDPASPWYRRVNLVGAKGMKRAVSLQSLRAAIEALFQSGEVKALSLEQKYAIALAFWRVIADVWPEAWNAPRSSLLTKSMGTLAVAKLGGYLLPRCLGTGGARGLLNEERLRGYLGRAADVNWMSDGSFKGYAGRHGADFVKQQLDDLIFSQRVAAGELGQ